jgi:alanine dehydrogenase
MTIGIPKELAAEERRIALTPVGVYELVRGGSRVLVESGAGEECGFPDAAFAEVGAELIFSAEEVFRRSDLVVKVLPPTRVEAERLTSEQTLFCFFPMGLVTRDAYQVLLERGVTVIAFECIEDQAGSLPILEVMSEIAGTMLPQIAGRFLESTAGGRGILLSGISGIPGANVVILGAGVVGTNATEAFLGAGAQVLVLDRDLHRLRQIDLLFQHRASTALVTPLTIEKAVRFADVLVTAVFIHGERTPHLVSEAMVLEMKERALIMDVSIDQGGAVETSHPTTHSDPVFVKHGVIHYAVPNIPSAVARTASYALNNVVLPFVREMDERGVREALRFDPILARGVIALGGGCTNEGLSQLYGLSFRPVEDLLGE